MTNLLESIGPVNVKNAAIAWACRFELIGTPMAPGLTMEPLVKLIDASGLDRREVEAEAARLIAAHRMPVGGRRTVRRHRKRPRRSETPR